MPVCANIIPSERIRVLYQFSTKNKSGTSWREVRQRIKDALEECVYLNPLIIEDFASIPLKQKLLNFIKNT